MTEEAQETAAGAERELDFPLPYGLTQEVLLNHSSGDIEWDEDRIDLHQDLTFFLTEVAAMPLIPDPGPPYGPKEPGEGPRPWEINSPILMARAALALIRAWGDRPNPNYDPVQCDEAWMTPGKALNAAILWDRG